VSNIEYDPKTGKYKAELDGSEIGYFDNYFDADVALEKEKGKQRNENCNSSG